MGEYELFEGAQELIRDFYRNHEATRLSAGDPADRERVIRRYMRFLHSRSVDEGQLRRTRFICRNITHFAPELRKLLDEMLSRWRKNGERPGSPAHIYALYLLTGAADETLFADIADTCVDYDTMRAVWGKAFQEPGAQSMHSSPSIWGNLFPEVSWSISCTGWPNRRLLKNNEWIADMTASACVVIYPKDVIRIVQRLALSGLLKESRTDYLEGVRETLKNYRREEHLGRVRSSGFYGFVDNSVEELRVALSQFDREPGSNSGAHHRLGYSDQRHGERRVDPSSFEPAGSTITAAECRQSEEGTIYRAKKKVGRNEPCPCGSGDKSKRCRGR